MHYTRATFVKDAANSTGGDNRGCLHGCERVTGAEWERPQWRNRQHVARNPTETGTLQDEGHSRAEDHGPHRPTHRPGLRR